MNQPRRIIVNWRSPQSRQIMPVAELRVHGPDGPYELGYLEGVRDALRVGFHAFPSFPDLEARYEAKELFAFFQNRVMPRSRPDFPAYAAALGLDPAEGGFDVAELLGRGRGLRETDRIETVLVPTQNPDDGGYSTHFLVRAVRHVDGAEDAASQLRAGDLLRTEIDANNPVNPRARKLAADAGVVGYLPDYLVAELDALERAGAEPRFVVERVNPPPMPAHHRILVRLEADWPEGHRPLDAPAFQPFSADSAVA